MPVKVWTYYYNSTGPAVDGAHWYNDEVQDLANRLRTLTAFILRGESDA